MGKIISFMNSLKGFSIGKRPTPDTGEIDRNRADDYAVEKKSTSFYVASVAVSVIGALVIWLLAVSAGTTEKIFSVQPEMRGLGELVSVAQQSGFTIELERDVNVSFALEGRPKVVDNVTNDDILVYVSLEKLVSDVEKLPNNVEQTLTAEIVIEAPAYFNVVDISKEKVTIKLLPINKTTE